MPTHHQMPLAIALHNLLGDRFRFGIVSPLAVDRRALGWQDAETTEKWVIRRWESHASEVEYDRWVTGADVVIGYPPRYAISKQRVRNKRLCLLAGERIWKPTAVDRGLSSGSKLAEMKAPVKALHHVRVARYWLRWRSLDGPYCHYLAIGSLAAADQAKLRLFTDRMWTYGYFVAIPAQPPRTRKVAPPLILWAGRMLDWKRVADLIEATHHLQTKNIPFDLELIGSGPEEGALRERASRLGLGASVSFRPSVSPTAVRSAMQDATALVLSSSAEEGWGAVIGEAMSEGCVAIASSAAGAARVLITPGRTGFLYEEGDTIGLASILEQVLSKPDTAGAIGLNAWSYMRDLWCPEVAAERLVAFISGLMGEGPIPCFSDGPLSPAVILPESQGKSVR